MKPADLDAISKDVLTYLVKQAEERLEYTLEIRRTTLNHAYFLIPVVASLASLCLGAALTLYEGPYFIPEKVWQYVMLGFAAPLLFMLRRLIDIARPAKVYYKGMSPNKTWKTEIVTVHNGMTNDRLMKAKLINVLERSQQAIDHNGEVNDRSNQRLQECYQNLVKWVTAAFISAAVSIWLFG